MTGRAGPAALVGAVVLVACGEAPEVRDPSTPERSGPSPLGIAAPLDPTAEAGASGSSTPAAVSSAATAVVAPSPSSSGASAAPRTRPSPSAAAAPVFRWSVSGPLRRADVLPLNLEMSLAPAAPDFSGWNCVELTGPASTCS